MLRKKGYRRAALLILELIHIFSARTPPRTTAMLGAAVTEVHVLPSC
jgi:hypothetical protein